MQHRYNLFYDRIIRISCFTEIVKSSEFVFLLELIVPPFLIFIVIRTQYRVDKVDKLSCFSFDHLIIGKQAMSIYVVYPFYSVKLNSGHVTELFRFQSPLLCRLKLSVSSEFRMILPHCAESFFSP